MKEFITEYANLADDGAPYAGPTILAHSLAYAQLIVETSVRGPNGEELTVVGELAARLAPDVHGDTKTWIRPT
jgi:hypothetical protein